MGEDIKNRALVRIEERREEGEYVVCVDDEELYSARPEEVAHVLGIISGEFSQGISVSKETYDMVQGIIPDKVKRILVIDEIS